MKVSVIWDIDGTLFDTYPSFVDAYLGALRDAGVAELPSRAEVESLCRVSLSHCVRELAARFGLVAAEYGDRFDERYRAIPLREQRPFEGAAEVCRAVLARGGLNLVATHRSRSSTEGLLAEHGMRRLFSDIASVEDGLPKKPDPGVFRVLIARAALSPERVVAVGDRDIDILAGKAAGLRTCLFRGDDRGSGADFEFSEYRELGRYLETL